MDRNFIEQQAREISDYHQFLGTVLTKESPTEVECREVTAIFLKYHPEEVSVAKGFRMERTWVRLRVEFNRDGLSDACLNDLAGELAAGIKNSNSWVDKIAIEDATFQLTARREV